MNKNVLLPVSYYFGLLLMLTGVLFKIQHYPGNDFILISGAVLSLAFIVLAFTEILRSPNIRNSEKVLWLCGLISLYAIAGFVYVSNGRKRVVR